MLLSIIYLTFISPFLSLLGLRLCFLLRYFFFSSRRRHTRWPRDWSSDVCSSDLKTCMRVGKLIQLVFDGLDNVRMAVAQAGNSSAAAGIDIAFAILVDDFDAIASNGYR